MNNVAALQVPRLATYGDIAEEYYDPVRHPTCASLRELSSRYLVPRLTRLSGNERLLVEVGVGKSIVAPVWSSSGFDLGSLVLIDSSAEMLSYSAEWGRLGARMTIAEATATQLVSGSVDVLVASLGDPYNTLAFWKEAVRILRPGGICHFTTPAYEWASKFRATESRSEAEFVRADGALLFLPSPVHTEKEQAELFVGAGLEIVETQPLTLRDMSSQPAPKLLCVTPDEPVVRGYSVKRPHC